MAVGFRAIVERRSDKANHSDDAVVVVKGRWRRDAGGALVFGKASVMQGRKRGEEAHRGDDQQLHRAEHDALPHTGSMGDDRPAGDQEAWRPATASSAGLSAGRP
jgi:hypothetical protein